MASILIPALGRAQEWITSEEVVRSWISVSIGRTARCSTSRRRKSVGWGSFFMIESNDLILLFLRYSYVQYHCRPIALTEACGMGISSIRYRSRREGKARKMRITAGRIVQTVSRMLASRSWREVRRDIIRLISM